LNKNKLTKESFGKFYFYKSYFDLQHTIIWNVSSLRWLHLGVNTWTALLNYRSTAAEDGIVILYLKNTSLIVGNSFKISRSFYSNLKKDNAWRFAKFEFLDSDSDYVLKSLSFHILPKKSQLKFWMTYRGYNKIFTFWIT